MTSRPFGDAPFGGDPDDTPPFRTADPVYPCGNVGEIPALVVAELLQDGGLTPDGIGFVRTGEWVAWVGGDRRLRAVRLG